LENDIDLLLKELPINTSTIAPLNKLAFLQQSKLASILRLVFERWGGSLIKPIALVFGSLILFGCASSSVLDVANDTIQVSTSAAPVCGKAGAQAVAAKRAAIETIKRGYDSYMVVDANSQDNVRVVGTTPITANTYTNGTINAYGNTATYNGQSNTYFSGGQPIIGGHHDEALMVRMFRQGDAGSDRAVDARLVLGPDWQNQIQKSTLGTC
jgi:hypothetical protein